MIFIQRDNFFPDIEYVRDEVLKVSLLSCADYNAKYKREETWPGMRSWLLSEVAPELNTLIDNNIQSLPWFKELKFHKFVHFRGADSSVSQVHNDNVHLAGLIYINATNPSSGTLLHEAGGDVINDIKYVQNRLVIYSGAYPHNSYGHFGSDPATGRLTINLFLDLDQVKEPNAQ